MAKIVLIKIWNSGLEIRESIWWIKVICCYFFNIYICVIKKEISYQEYSTCNIKEFIIFPFRNVERLVMNSSQYHIFQRLFSDWAWNRLSPYEVVIDQCLITRIKRLYTDQVRPYLRYSPHGFTNSKFLRIPNVCEYFKGLQLLTFFCLLKVLGYKAPSEFGNRKTMWWITQLFTLNVTFTKMFSNKLNI